MDLRKVLARLREERVALDLAIAELERMGRNGHPRDRDLRLVTKIVSPTGKARSRASKSGA
jgi:hypothetical protein